MRYTTNISQTMERWISILITITLLHPSNNEQSDYGCSYETLLTNEKQIICINISSNFFQYFNINLNRSRWFTCKNCNLSTITNDTFNLPKNSINSLILIGNNVVSVSNQSFTKLPFLKILNLRENLIKSLNKDTFHGISNLLQLDLSKNLLENFDEEVFLNLQNLDILNLSSNRISKIYKNLFNGLYNLKYLYLNDNKITTLIANTFQRLPNLKILYLEYNLIEELHPWAFNNLRNLNYLYLNNNSIIALVQYNFKPLTNLIELQLRGNRLTFIDTSTFNGLTNLRYLYLGINNLETIRSYGLIGLNSLETIELIENNFEIFCLSYVNNLDNLKILWLENNKISSFIVNPREDVQKNLTIINLEKNNVRYINYKLLHTKLPRLNEFWIGFNNWTCDFIIEMYDYFSNNNVTLCVNGNCSSTAVKHYIEVICFEPYENEIELDFVADGINTIGFNSYILSVTCILLIDYFISTSI